MTDTTVVHLLRHGDVHNPDTIMYGRLPGYHLSAEGRRTAGAVAHAIAHRDIVLLMSSPLARTRETAAPLAAAKGLKVCLDHRLIEVRSVFEGRPMGRGLMRNPRYYRHLWNPLRPSWGEPYASVAERMASVISEARERARGHEAVLVSHQVPIRVACLVTEGRRPWRHGRRCAPTGLITLTFEGDRLAGIDSSEPPHRDTIA